MSAIRLFWVSWLFQIRTLTASGFFVLISLIQPIIFATIAFEMWRSGARPGTLLAVALGVGLMGSCSR